MKLHKYKRIFPDLIKMLLIATMIVPVCVTCLHIYPAADDFSNAFITKNAIIEYKSYFGAALAYAYTLYKTTSGYFFAVFLNFFLSPFLRFGTMGIRVFCLVTNLLFYFAVYFFVRVTAKSLGKITDNGSILTIYTLALFCFTNIYLNIESNFWYCVSVGYVLIIILMLFGTGSFILAVTTKRKRFLIIAIILGVLSSSSSLNVVALNCFLYLVIGIYGWLIKKAHVESITGFIFPLISGLVNLASPGNFMRHEAVSSDYDIAGALVNSTLLVLSRLYKLFSASLLPWILVFLFVYIWLYTDRINISINLHPALMGTIWLFALIVFAFPVYLGYGDDYFPGRCIFVQDTAMYIFLFVLTVYSVNWLKNKWPDNKKEGRKHHMALALFVLFIPFCMWHSGKTLADAYPSLYLTEQLTNGNIAMFDAYWEGVLEEIETSPDDDVVIRREPFKYADLLKNPGLTDDPAHWINAYVAWYYGKNSAQLIYE